MLLETLEYMMYEGFRNGMSFKQVKDRIPALAAKKLGITVAQFHQQLEAISGPSDCNFKDLADRVVAKFTPAEQRAIARRK